MRHIGTTKIKAIGIGGAGSNAISRIFNNPIHGIEYITINTDLQDLQNNNAPIRVLIGNSTNEGNGLGGDYDKAKSCFEKDYQIIWKFNEYPFTSSALFAERDISILSYSSE